MSTNSIANAESRSKMILRAWLYILEIRYIIMAGRNTNRKCREQGLNCLGSRPTLHGPQCNRKHNSLYDVEEMTYWTNGEICFKARSEGSHIWKKNKKVKTNGASWDKDLLLRSRRHWMMMHISDSRECNHESWTYIDSIQLYMAHNNFHPRNQQ